MQAIFNQLLAAVSFRDVAKSVCDALLALDLDDLDAGSRAGGYVEPSETAWASIEKAVIPFLQDLERRVKLRHDDEAAELCKGIVLGLCRAETRVSNSSSMQKTAHRTLPAAPSTSGNAGAAKGGFRAALFRGVRQTGIGSFAELIIALPPTSVARTMNAVRVEELVRAQRKEWTHVPERDDPRVRAQFRN